MFILLLQLLQLETTLHQALTQVALTSLRFSHATQ